MTAPPEDDWAKWYLPPLKVIKPDGSQYSLEPFKILFPGGLVARLESIEDFTKNIPHTGGSVMHLIVTYLDGSVARLKPGEFYSGGPAETFGIAEFTCPAGHKVFPNDKKSANRSDSRDTDDSICSSDSEESQRPRVFTPPSDADASLVSDEEIDPNASDASFASSEENYPDESEASLSSNGESDLNGSEASLQYAEDIHTQDFDLPILNVLKSTLQYRSSPEMKSVKLANDINFICKSAELYGAPGGVATQDILWWVWLVLLDIVRCIPAGHPWQDSLVLAVQHLRQQPGYIRSDLKYQLPGLLWKHLPDLGMVVREAWLEPYGATENLAEKLDRWKNLNSFIARIFCSDFSPTNFAIWEIRASLEEPPVKGSEMECRLWVASEWIIRCAGIIFEYITSGEDLDESMARAHKGGSLCDSISPHSLERWNFWKTRFSKIRADAGVLELEDSVLQRISDALESMDAVDNYSNEQPSQRVADKCPGCAGQTSYRNNSTYTIYNTPIYNVGYCGWPQCSTSDDSYYAFIYVDINDPHRHFHVEYRESLHPYSPTTYTAFRHIRYNTSLKRSWSY